MSLEQFIYIIPCISIVISIVSLLITIVFWIVDKYKQNRPYLDISFEQIRGSLACIIIKNVGNTPAELTSIKFNSDFINQLDDKKIRALKSKRKTDIKIYPKRYWVISFDKNIYDIVKFPETILEIEYTYKKIRIPLRKYNEKVSIDFKEYGDFLLHPSNQDEHV